MPLVVEQFLKYGLVGVMNTVITLSVIAGLSYIGFAPVTCNIAGYAFGLLNSFLFNGRFTFDSTYNRRVAYRFLIGFALAYGLNLIVLVALTRQSDLPEMASQLVAMVAYNVGFFLVMKFWVFDKDG
ncbi:GtrA family protein [Martelella lutilitoris]|uniref:GtrA family protein n=1 Tax=Martelella lutilitoris TaxID=2583532 RepID=A0A5C4JVT3_9HYPH|nr:GtrA family protein [Martelella lutilitoris]TNB49578.1 GtrA family protein [Martelella lutilitoris]